MWRGRIYTGSKFGVTVGKPVIYHGLFATGFFQSIYPAEPSSALMLCTSLEYHAAASLPLLVLSAPFPELLPLAITAALMPLIICITAGLQADLPRSKRRFWSRPLVALLFFLQPICRGWARYKGRLSLSPTPRTVEGRFLAAANQTPANALGLVEYWIEGQIDRPAFVKRVMQRLDEQGWDFRSDAGFCEYDIDIFGNRWAHLQVVTVLEPHQGKHLLKCRLKTTWSLLGKVGLSALLGAEILVIGLIGPSNPWLWLLLLTLPLFVWYLKCEQRNLQRWIAVLLDAVAEKDGMQKINRTPRDASAQAPDSPERKDAETPCKAERL